MSNHKGLMVALLALTCCSVAFSEGYAARVNKQTISTEQVHQLMGGDAANAASAPAERKIAATQALVRQAVLLQAARKEKLDQEPAVQLSLENLERQFLAEAWVAKTLGASQRPSEADIGRFISDNSHLFEQRQTVHYHRVDVPHATNVSDGQLKDIVRLHKDVSGVAQALRRSGVAHRLQSLWQGTEQIEPDLIKTLTGMPNRSLQVVNLPTEGRWVVMERLASYADPVDSRAVRSSIAQGLFAEQRQAKAEQLLQRLRSQASIEIIDKPVDTAARVNGLPVSTQELDHRIRELSIPAEAKESKKRVLEQLIDQHLLVQQADREGLRKQPGVPERIAQLKEARLAAQYLERTSTASAGNPTEREIVQFINGRPAYFAERKIFRYKETVLAMAAQDQLENVRNAIAGKSSREIEQWATSTGAVVARNAPWLGPDRLPQQHFVAMAQMQPGQSRAIAANGGQAISVLELIATHDDPLDDEQARSVASDILRQQAKAKAAQEIVEKLVAKADIEYAPEYKPRDAVRMTTADWGKRQWAGFSAWTAQFASLVLLVAGVIAFAVKSRAQIGFVMPLLSAPSERAERTWIQDLSRSYGFIVPFGALLLALAAVSTLLQWSIIRTLIVQERILVGAAAGSFLGLCLVAGVWMLSRGRSAPFSPGRWTAALLPACATTGATALVWFVFGR